jgi:hypothetical protein
VSAEQNADVVQCLLHDVSQTFHINGLLLHLHPLCFNLSVLVIYKDMNLGVAFEEITYNYR